MKHHLGSSPQHTVLIIDDEAGVTRLTERLLKRSGYQVVGVNQPQLGLDLLNKEPIDLLLVDIRMPGLNGFQVMEHARQAHPNIAIVVMTGYGTVDIAVEALRRGANGMVLKPFTGEELVQSVDQALKETHRQAEVQRLRVLRPLFRVVEAFFSEKNPENLLELISSTTCDLLDCEEFAILIRENGDGSTIVSGLSLSNEMTNTVIDYFLSGEEAQVFSSREQVEPTLQKLMEEKNLGHLIGAKNRMGTAVSVMLAGRRVGHPSFRKTDVELFTLLTRQGAAALENARLYAALEDKIKTIETSQQALFQAEKMAAVGRLTAAIAHEINNPLQSLQNCIHLIASGRLSEEDESVYLQLATEELERLVSTTQRMLDYYRPGLLDRSPVDPNTLIHRVIMLLETQSRHQRVHFELDLEERIPSIVAVGNQIQQVIFNLVLNAIEAIEEGGKIYITSSFNGEAVQITVEDTGPGVPNSMKDKLFEPFESTKKEGLGLGLAVSYGIITAHGGQIKLLPQQGKGARFQISLPVGR